jgi:uncharacterized protein involved in exopolysaccharide biosynthesis
MFLDNKPLISRRHFRLAKNYKWRVLRLSILISILTVLVVNTIPSVYLGTTKLHLHPIKNSVVSDAYVPLTNTESRDELTNEFKQILSVNLANATLTKVKKFNLLDINSELKNVISEFKVIKRIKQKVRTALPFMPQEEAKALSSKQLASLKNDYTLDKIIQSLDLGWSDNSSEIYVGYKDSNPVLAVIISDIAANLYQQSVTATKLQLFDQVLNQISSSGNRSATINTVANATSYYQKHIAGVDESINYTSQQIIKLKHQLKNIRSQLKNMIFIRTKVRKYGLNVLLLLQHKQIAEHAFIKPLKQQIEIVENKLSNLTESSEHAASQISATKKELALQKKELISNLNSLASNIDTYIQETQYELNILKKQLKTRQKEDLGLARLRKKLIQSPIDPPSDEVNEFQTKLNHITDLAAKHVIDKKVTIESYKTERLKPNKMLIVSLSFILSISIISILVLVLIHLKESYRKSTKPNVDVDVDTTEFRTK